MAITKITPPTTPAPLTTDDYAAQNSILQQKIYDTAKNTFILTEWDTLTQPEIAEGITINHGGTLYIVDTDDEAIGGAPADGRVYIKVAQGGAPLGSILNATFVTSVAGYSWNHAYQGFYHADGSQLLPIVLVKYDTSSWLKFDFFDYKFQGFTAMDDPVLLPFKNMDAIYNDDLVEAVPEPDPANIEYWPFCSPDLSSSEGTFPQTIEGQVFVDSDDANARFADRGVIRNETGFMLIPHTFGNAGTVKFRIRPEWILSPTDAYEGIFDTREGGASADSIYLYYESASSKLILKVRDTAGVDEIVTESDAFTVLGDLQDWLDIVIMWDKSNNDDADGKGNAKLYIDGVEQDGVAHGTKTKSGTGISAINITRTQYLIGSIWSADPPDNPAEMYYTQLQIEDSWDDDTTNYDGTAACVPYYGPDWLTLKNNNGLTRGSGVMAAKAGFFEGVYGVRRAPNFYYDNNTQTQGYFYSIISPAIPNIGDSISLNGQISGSIVMRAVRTGATTIDIYGYNIGTSALIILSWSEGGAAANGKCCVSW